MTDGDEVIDEKYPICSGLYDPSYPNGTSAHISHFIELLEELAEEWIFKGEEGKMHNVNMEIKKIKQLESKGYDWIVIGDLDDWNNFKDNSHYSGLFDATSHDPYQKSGVRR